MASDHWFAFFRVVAVQQDHVIGTSFHPELTDDYRWHVYFLKNVIKWKGT